MKKSSWNCLKSWWKSLKLKSSIESSINKAESSENSFEGQTNLLSILASSSASTLTLINWFPIESSLTRLYICTFLHLFITAVRWEWKFLAQRIDIYCTNTQNCLRGAKCQSLWTFQSDFFGKLRNSHSFFNYYTKCFFIYFQFEVLFI